MEGFVEVSSRLRDSTDAAPGARALSMRLSHLLGTEPPAGARVTQAAFGGARSPPLSWVQASIERVASCARAAQIVKHYNTLAPGASRKGYLVLLHKLQRDCAKQAAKLGLTGDYLPACKRLDQENCTMYAKAKEASVGLAGEAIRPDQLPPRVGDDPRCSSRVSQRRTRRPGAGRAGRARRRERLAERGFGDPPGGRRDAARAPGRARPGCWADARAADAMINVCETRRLMARRPSPCGYSSELQARADVPVPAPTSVVRGATASRLRHRGRPGGGRDRVVLRVEPPGWGRLAVLPQEGAILEAHRVESGDGSLVWPTGRQTPRSSVHQLKGA